MVNGPAQYFVLIIGQRFVGRQWSFRGAFSDFFEVLEALLAPLLVPLPVKLSPLLHSLLDYRIHLLRVPRAQRLQMVLLT